MAYTIHNSSGAAVTVPDNVIDTAYYNPNANGSGIGVGTQLVGRNTVDYGAPIAQNFLQMTENFASTSVPVDSKAVQGQLWFDKTSLALYVRTGASLATGGLANWNKISTVASSTATTGSDGDIQVLSGPTRVNVWAGGAWRQVFPAVYS